MMTRVAIDLTQREIETLRLNLNWQALDATRIGDIIAKIRMELPPNPPKTVVIGHDFINQLVIGRKLVNWKRALDVPAEAVWPEGGQITTVAFYENGSIAVDYHGGHCLIEQSGWIEVRT